MSKYSSMRVEEMRRQVEINSDAQARVVATITEIQLEFAGTGITLSCPHEDCNNNNIEVTDWNSERNIEKQQIKESVKEVSIDSIGGLALGSIVREMRKLLQKDEKIVVSGFDIPQQPASGQPTIECTVCDFQNRRKEYNVKQLELSPPVIASSTDDEIKKLCNDVRGTKVQDHFDIAVDS